MIEPFVPVTDIKFSQKELSNFNPLVLSFVGDGVNTLFMRTLMLMKSPYKNGQLHLLTSGKVCASAQAKAAKTMFPLLSEEEQRIFKKAKNGKIHSVPKNAELYDYQLATALEAVTGYLYLAGFSERLKELYAVIYEELVPESEISATQNEINGDTPTEDTQC